MFPFQVCKNSPKQPPIYFRGGYNMASMKPSPSRRRTGPTSWRRAPRAPRTPRSPPLHGSLKACGVTPRDDEDPSASGREDQLNYKLVWHDMFYSITTTIIILFIRIGNYHLIHAITYSLIRVTDWILEPPNSQILWRHTLRWRGSFAKWPRRSER